MKKILAISLICVLTTSAQLNGSAKQRKMQQAMQRTTNQVIKDLRKNLQNNFETLKSATKKGLIDDAFKKGIDKIEAATKKPNVITEDIELLVEDDFRRAYKKNLKRLTTIQTDTLLATFEPDLKKIKTANIFQELYQATQVINQKLSAEAKKGKMVSAKLEKLFTTNILPTIKKEVSRVKDLMEAVLQEAEKLLLEKIADTKTVSGLPKLNEEILEKENWYMTKKLLSAQQLAQLIPEPEIKQAAQTLENAINSFLVDVKTAYENKKKEIITSTEQELDLLNKEVKASYNLAVENLQKTEDLDFAVHSSHLPAGLQKLNDLLEHVKEKIGEAEILNKALGQIVDSKIKKISEGMSEPFVKGMQDEEENEKLIEETNKKIKTVRAEKYEQVKNRIETEFASFESNLKGYKKSFDELYLESEQIENIFILHNAFRAEQEKYSTLFEAHKQVALPQKAEKIEKRFSNLFKDVEIAAAKAKNRLTEEIEKKEALFATADNLKNLPKIEQDIKNQIVGLAEYENKPNLVQDWQNSFEFERRLAALRIAIQTDDIKIFISQTGEVKEEKLEHLGLFAARAAEFFDMEIEISDSTKQKEKEVKRNKIKLDVAAFVEKKLDKILNSLEELQKAKLTGKAVAGKTVSQTQIDDLYKVAQETLIHIQTFSTKKADLQKRLRAITQQLTEFIKEIIINGVTALETEREKRKKTTFISNFSTEQLSETTRKIRNIFNRLKTSKNKLEQKALITLFNIPKKTKIENSNAIKEFDNRITALESWTTELKKEK